jgi:Rrf2 family protein
MKRKSVESSIFLLFFLTWGGNEPEEDLKSRQKRSYTEYGPKKSDIALLKLTKKADYGLIALKYLAEHPERPALSAKDVADAYGIPAQLLAKILQRLTKTGLLRSHAGMNGGYALARDARQISAYEVILAIDGPFFITSCTKGKKGCELTPSCTIKEPLARVNDTIAGVLKSISIQDLAEHEQPAGLDRRGQAKEEARLVSLTL